MRRTSARGSALLLAIISVLVLTIVGVGLVYFASTEDRISGNDKLQKEGFYAAEMGLRAGEIALTNAMSSTAANTTLLTTPPLSNVRTPHPPNASPNSLDLHDGGFPATLLTSGTVGTYRDIPVTFAASTPNDQAYYTLYVRNNEEDKSGSATADGDMRLNLIAVGFVSLPNGQQITKILEEQISAQNTGTEGALQKQGNSGGTGGI